MPSDSTQEYERLRDRLVALQSAAVPDQAAIDRLIGELELLQLKIKGEHGIKGNNPLE